MKILPGNQNAWVPHWQTGERFYGQIPELANRSGLIPAGPIELRAGQYGPKGFGLNHIWQRHSTEVLKHSKADIAGLTDGDKVGLVQRFVAAIVAPGIPIYCEFEDIRGKHRLQVLKSSAGIAVLQPMHHREDGLLYSVVTAYTKRSATGSRVGLVAPM